MLQKWQRNHLRPEGQERRALSIHEQELAGAELPPPRVVVDPERQPARVVVDAEAVGALEAHAGPLPHRVQRRLVIRGGGAAVVKGVGVGRVYPLAGGDVAGARPRRHRVHRRLLLVGLRC